MGRVGLKINMQNKKIQRLEKLKFEFKMWFLREIMVNSMFTVQNQLYKWVNDDTVIRSSFFEILHTELLKFYEIGFI